MKLGPVTLPESDTRGFEESWSEDGRRVDLAGTVFSPQITYSQAKKIHDDILNLPQQLIALVLDRKSHRNGYYWVRSSKSSFRELPGEQLILITWEVELVRVGADTEIDLESRMSGPLARLNDHALSAERWHAPAIGHAGYWVGAVQPAQVQRMTAEGLIRVYRNLPLNVNARWTCPVENYYTGAAKLIEDGLWRVGRDLELGTQWTLTNGLIRVMPGAAGTLDVQFWTGAAWSGIKTFNVTAAATALTAGMLIAADVIRNEPHVVIMRLLYNATPSGRYTVDLIMRRGARFVDVVAQSYTSVTLGVVRATNEAAVTAPGYVRAAANDAAGGRYVIGSAKTFTGDLSAGGISKGASIRLDTFIGWEQGGDAAVAGDGAAQLMLQYLSCQAEEVQGVSM